MLHHFIKNVISPEVTTLELFCDGCAGQNKNYTLFRFLHMLVNVEKRFKSISIRFPIRGHSYLECDRDMALIKQSTDIDLPEEWHQVFKEARAKPSPFNVIPCDQGMFKAYTEHLKPAYRASCPLKTRPVRELFVDVAHPQLFSFRDSWNGMMETAVVVSRQSHKLLPLRQTFTGPIAISREKYNDLQCLKNLCSPNNQGFNDNLCVADSTGASRDDTDSDSDA